MLLKHSPGCLWAEWVGVDDTNEFSDLNSISSLPSGDVSEDRWERAWKDGQQRDLLIRKVFLNNCGGGMLARTKWGDNMTSGETIGNKGEDVFCWAEEMGCGRCVG